MSGESFAVSLSQLCFLTASSLSISSDWGECTPAGSSSGEDARKQGLSRLAPSSRAWSFACRAYLAQLTKKKRDCSWSTLRLNTFVKLKSLFWRNFPVVHKVNNAIFIQWITKLVSQLLIHWIVIYAFQSLNNRGQVNKSFLLNSCNFFPQQGALFRSVGAKGPFFSL